MLAGLRRVNDGGSGGGVGSEWACRVEILGGYGKFRGPVVMEQRQVANEHGEGSVGQTHRNRGRTGIREAEMVGAQSRVLKVIFTLVPAVVGRKGGVVTNHLDWAEARATAFFYSQPKHVEWRGGGWQSDQVRVPKAVAGYCQMARQDL